MELAAWLLATPLCVLLGYLTLELLLGLPPLKASTLGKGTPPPSSMILIPAYNEAANIAQTVEALRKVAPAASILVVADNCTDDTARLARAAGAQTAERFDMERRGKGYALAFGREVMRADPPEAVLVMDADCALAPGSAARLAALAVSLGQPVQASNLLVSHADAAPLVRISNFAMMIKNLVRARGLMRLGRGALLFGTGMAFPWFIFERLPLATADAVEDLQMGLWLAAENSPVALDDQSFVTSQAASVEDSRGQRSRWEHGFLQTATRQALPLMMAGLRHRSRLQFALGAHLMVPPLALLMLLAVAFLALVALLCALSDQWLPLWVAALAFAGLSFALLLAWWREGRSILPFSALLKTPLYVLWKIPIYVGFYINRQRGWNRTRREGESDDGSSATR